MRAWADELVAAGTRSEVDIAALVPDPGKTIEQGAVLPWNSGGRRLSMYAAGELGVRLDVPYRSLTSRVCSVCHGTRLRPEALTSQLGGRNIAEISALGLGDRPRVTSGVWGGTSEDERRALRRPAEKK